MAEILINAEEVRSCVKYKSGKVCIWLDGVKEIREVPTHGDWHIGNPTEDGWYLQCIKSKNNITYDTDYYENGDWRYPCIFREIVAWQKIEPFEVGTEERE